MPLAFDLATVTGWATDDDQNSSGWFDLKKLGFRPLHQARQAFARLLLEQLSKDVVVEQPQHFKSRDAARVCYSLYGILREEVLAGGRQLHEVNGSTLKKWATGDGRAKKPQMCAAATARLCRPIKNHNEADAILLSIYAREVLGLK